MQKQKENLFQDKFRLLNSQEHTEDIKWSSSSSGEYENTSCNEKFNILDKSRNRKRKRKQKVPKNISNLDITIIDSCLDHKSDVVNEKSPILVSKRVAHSESPILMSSRLPPNKDIDNSPILCNKNFCPKSPIFNLKSASPNSVRVKKKLSYERNIKENGSEEVRHLEKNYSCCTEYMNNDERRSDNQTKEERKHFTESVYIKSESNSVTDSNEVPYINSTGSDSSMKIKLMEKVRNFFDSHFSSENTSQNISDTPTPTDCSKSEDIDILSCVTQKVAQLQSSKSESPSNSDTSYFDKNTKKVKHKKGGLAYRLNALLKKQNAQIALWQHERFLAGNSNFVIPKEENAVFQIQKTDFKYGCYLLNAVDSDNKKYLMIINNKYVNNNIVVNSIFKLYEPYKILELDHGLRIIINICKFECIVIKEINE